MKSKLFTKLFFLTCVIILLISCKPPKNQNLDYWVKNYALKPGNAAMIIFLDSINQKVEIELERKQSYSSVRKFINYFYKSDEQIMYDAKRALTAGKTKKAVSMLEKISLLNWNKESENAIEQKRINEWMAIAYLRMGEEKNCINNHNQNSCILPIKKNGIYKIKDPTKKAINIYLHILSIYPNDYRAMWLLNIAYQTLGEYPNNVPSKYLLGEKMMKDSVLTDNFKNIAPILGIAYNSLAGSSIIDDFNNDGYLDIVTSGRLKTQLQLFINNKKGGFINQTKKANLQGFTGGFNLLQADYNNDGFKDILVLRGSWLNELGKAPNSLLKNNGDGTFQDVTVSAGLLSFNPNLNAVWSDFNNDGWLDLFIGGEAKSKTDNYSLFYINNKDGSFSNISSKTGIKLNLFIKGVSAGDYNNDGWQDLFISVKGGDNYLYENKGIKSAGKISFSNKASEAGVKNPNSSFTSWFWDYNNDGFEDLYVSQYERKAGKSVETVAKSYNGLNTGYLAPYIYKNNGNGTFSNVAHKLKINYPLYAMGANFGDFNNDGFLDFYLGTGEPNYMGIYPNRMFYSDKGLLFYDVTAEKGVGHIQKGHGVAIADIDNDGDQDIYCQMGGMYSGDKFQDALFQNPGNKNNYITLSLKGVKSNKDAIGTRIEITCKKQKIYRTVNSGGSFGSNSLQQEIGLGINKSIDTLKIKWAGSNFDQYFYNVVPNKRYEVTEFKSALKIH